MKALLTKASRHHLGYVYCLRYIERCGLFIQREREWMNLRGALEHSLVADQILANLTVLHGPFAQMIYPAAKAMGSAFFPKLLGSYERELHPLLNQIIATGYSEIVDVGCAEGYYAIGFAMKIPNARVCAFDTDESALSACREMALKNQVSERILAGNFCGPVELMNIPFSRRGLVISDCEGFEKFLFTRQVCEFLAGHDVLIEVHDFRDPSISAMLHSAFAKTHSIEVIRTIPDRLRSDIFHYEELSDLNWETQTTLLAELRPANMEWLFCRGKANERR